MKLRVLVDNNTYIDQYYCGEPAVSYYIEDKDIKLLFDVGYSDLFLTNMKKFNIDINDIENIVISHGHDDHTRGLKYYFENIENHNLTITAHPDAFKEKKIGNLKICSPYLEEDLKKKCNLNFSKKPIKISENIVFLGEIPQINNFENRKAIGKKQGENNLEDDYVLDDSAIVYKSNDGIFIITGCSHSGVCNIIEYAKRVCNDNRVIGIIGGFHLFEVNEQLDNTINYIKSNNIEGIYPCHCTSLAVKAEMYKVLPIEEVGVGLEIEL